jgi:hypothetical protein
MEWPWVVLAATGVVFAGGVVVLVLGWKPLRAWAREAETQHARRLFAARRGELEATFFQAAAASGKPRGLRWKACEWGPAVEFARERASGRLTALVGVTIAFEAVEGSDMEGLPAVGNLRNASGVFFFDRGDWHTVGRAIFNLNPDEAIAHFGKQYERVEAG